MYQKLLLVLAISTSLVACGGGSSGGDPVVDEDPVTGNVPNTGNDPDTDTEVPDNCVSIPRPVEGQDRTTKVESVLLRPLSGTLTSFDSSRITTTNRKITAVSQTSLTEELDTHIQSSQQSTNTITAANISVVTNQINTGTINRTGVDTFTFSIANNYIDFTKIASITSENRTANNTSNSTHPQVPDITINTEGESQTNSVTNFNPFHRGPIDIVCENQTWTDTFVAVSTGTGNGTAIGTGSSNGSPDITSIATFQGGDITITTEDPSTGTTEYTFTVDGTPVNISRINTIEAINVAKTVRAGSFNTYRTRMEGDGFSQLLWNDIETNEIVYSESYDSSGTLINTDELISLQQN